MAALAEDRSWPCDCGSRSHYLSLLWWSEIPVFSICDEIRLTQYDPLSLRGWWARLRAALHLLLRGRHCQAEIVLNRQTAQELAEACWRAATVLREQELRTWREAAGTRGGERQRGHY